MVTKVHNRMIAGARLSALDFGAVGDGSTDNTTAFNDAIAAAQADGSSLYLPPGDYVCGTVTVSSSAKITIVGDEGATIQRTGTDVTWISPTGSIELEKLRFENYMIVVQCNSIAANSNVIVDSCEFSECGDITTSGGRVDFQGAITCGTAANAIDKLIVRNCKFDGDDFGVCYRSGFNRAEVQHCDFRNMHRMGVMLGDNTGDQKAFQNIDVSHNYFKDIIGNSATENEIHGALTYGHRVIYHANVVDTCYDIHTTTHDSEALYSKAFFYSVTNNHIIDGGRGDSFLTVKGVHTETQDPDTLASGTAYSRDGVISGNTCYSTALFESTYTISATTNGILVFGRANICDNTMLGDFSRGIAHDGGGHDHHNRIYGDCEYGIISTTDALDTQHNITIDHNEIRGDYTQAIAVSCLSSAAGGHVIESCNISNNICRSTGTVVTTHILIAIQTATTTANRLDFLTVSNNHIIGFDTGEAQAIAMITNQGGLALNGDITNAVMCDNILDEVTNVYRIDGSAGDVTNWMVTGGRVTNNTNRLLSNPTLATNMTCYGIRGDDPSERTGIATILNGTTFITVNMGFPDTLRPTSLENITVTPLETLGSASFFYVDTLSGDTFRIHTNVNPGADVDFRWEAKNNFYYSD